MVNGLEREWAGRAQVVRVDIRSAAGQTAAWQYNVRLLPTFIVFDGSGHLVWQRGGRASQGELRQALQAALDQR